MHEKTHKFTHVLFVVYILNSIRIHTITSKK